MSLNEARKIMNQIVNKTRVVESFVYYLNNAKQRGNRIWLAANGGSASVVSHFASDLMNLDFDVFCMNDNISRVSALTNDIGWEFVYVKQLKNFKKGDILILASVHGGGKIGDDDWSQNILLVAIEAKKKHGTILSLIGCDGGRLKELSDVSIIVPSSSCCYVEGFHSLYTHIICEKIKEHQK